MSLGQFLKETRYFLNKTQKEMAELVELSHSYYQRLEGNKTGRVPKKTLQKIAERTGIHENEIFRAAGIGYGSENVIIVPGSIEDEIMTIARFFRSQNIHSIADSIISCVREPNAETFRQFIPEFKKSVDQSNLQTQAWILAMGRYQEKLDRLPKLKPCKIVPKPVPVDNTIQLELQLT